MRRIQGSTLHSVTEKLQATHLLHKILIPGAKPSPLGEKCYDFLTYIARFHFVCLLAVDGRSSQSAAVSENCPKHQVIVQTSQLQSPSLRFAITQTTNTCFLSATRCSSSGAAALASHWCALRACPGSKRARHSTSWLNFHISETGGCQINFFSTHHLYLHFEAGGKNYF
jgi:hypothetical protein